MLFVRAHVVDGEKLAIDVEDGYLFARHLDEARFAQLCQHWADFANLRPDKPKPGVLVDRRVPHLCSRAGVRL